MAIRRMACSSGRSSPCARGTGPNARRSARASIATSTGSSPGCNTEARPAANGFAIFACAGEHDFFEAVQLDVPIERHELFVGATPRLLPLARLADRYGRYAAVVLDTRSARIFVFGLAGAEATTAIEGEQTSRTEVGGWSAGALPASRRQLRAPAREGGRRCARRDRARRRASAAWCSRATRRSSPSCAISCRSTSRRRSST